MSTLNHEIAAKHPNDADAVEFAVQALESVKLDREKRSSACDNSSHEASTENFNSASPKVAAVMSQI